MAPNDENMVEEEETEYGTRTTDFLKIASPAGLVGGLIEEGLKYDDQIRQERMEGQIADSEENRIARFNERQKLIEERKARDAENPNLLYLEEQRRKAFGLDSVEPQAAPEEQMPATTQPTGDTTALEEQVPATTQPTGDATALEEQVPATQPEQDFDYGRYSKQEIEDALEFIRDPENRTKILEFEQERHMLSGGKRPSRKDIEDELGWWLDNPEEMMEIRGYNDTLVRRVRDFNRNQEINNSLIDESFIENFEGDNKLTDAQLILKYGTPEQPVGDLGPVGRRQLRDKLLYKSRFLKRKQARQAKKAGTPLPGGSAPTAPSGSSSIVVAQPQTGTSQPSSYNVHRQTVSINGQPTSVITSNRSASLGPTEWDSLLNLAADPANTEAQSAQTALNNTFDVIGDLDTPAARQLSELWGAASQDEDNIRNATGLTPSEREQALKEVRTRKAQLAAQIPNVGDIGDAHERQQMAEERAAQSESRKEAADRIANYEDAYKTTRNRANAQQEETGVPVSDTQFTQMFTDEVNRREEASKAIRQFAETGVMGEPPQEEPAGAPANMSNPHGGFVYTQQDGNPFVRVEGTGPSGPLVPVKFLGNTGYPAPMNEMQVAALPKGSIYFAPGENTLSSKDSGNVAPNQLAVLQTEKELAERTAFVEKASEGIHKEQSDAFFKYDTEYLPESITQYDLARSMLSTLDLPTITPGMVYSGEAAQIIEEHAEDLVGADMKTQALMNLITPTLDPNSEAGKQARRDALQRRLEIREESKALVREHEIRNEERGAPYHNTISSFQQSIVGNEDSVVYTDPVTGVRKPFEAYTISQKDSLFYGKSLPVLRDSNDLMEIDPSMWTNMAYYNPTAGRVLASIAPKGSQKGEYTPAQFDSFINDMEKLFPEDFFVSTEHAKAVFDEFTKHMGFTGPQN